MKTTASALDEAMALLRSTGTRIAVVGASNNRSKYGNIIVRNLTAHGYQVVPVNLTQPTIEGITAYRSLAEVPKPVDIVNIVTPPAATRRILAEAAAAGMSLVWLQDGSFDDAALEEALAAPFQTVHHACIMVAASRVHASPDA